MSRRSTRPIRPGDSTRPSGVPGAEDGAEVGPWLSLPRLEIPLVLGAVRSGKRSWSGASVTPPEPDRSESDRERD